MNERDFAYWLNGFAELTGDTPPTAEQWKSIREHLATVFVKVTPQVRLGQMLGQPNMQAIPYQQNMPGMSGGAIC